MVLARDVDVQLLTPYVKQWPLVHSPKKRVICRAGRRSGKTTGVATRASKRFLEGARILYATPTSDQLATFWNLVKRTFAEPIDAGAYHVNETEHVLEMPLLRSRYRVRIPSPNRIRCKTAWHEDSMRGDFGDELIFDEWQMMHESAWEEVGAPMLIDNNGNAVFCYTPPSLKRRAMSRADDKLHASKMFKRATSDSRWEAVHFTSFDNPYLPREGLEEVTQDMTALAVRQEIHAEDIEEVPGALWKRSQFGRDRMRPKPERLTRIVVAVDPTGSTTGDEVGIVVVGLGADGFVYVLADASIGGLSPEGWASRVVQTYYLHEADRIIGERNFGGDMVQAIIRTADPNISYKDVHASRGKQIRAEPVSALYEQGKVFHCGDFPELIDQMVMWEPSSGWSPDRLDAAVWAISELGVRPRWSVVVPD